MSNFFLYAGYGLSRKKSKGARLMPAFSDSPRYRDCVAIPKTLSLLISGVISTAGRNLDPSPSLGMTVGRELQRHNLL